MPTHAGKFPTSITAESFLTNRGGHKSSVTAKRREWDLSAGWHPIRKEGWKKGLKTHFKTLYGIDGKKYKVAYYPDADFDDVIGYHAHESDNTRCQKLLARAEAAFSTDNPTGAVSEAEGCGHITHLAYAEHELILKVAFEDGSVCIFDKVPPAIAGTLLHFARSGTKRRDGRHYLGIEFWNLIRIRGQLHGAKYPFEYEAHADYKLTGHNGRYKVTLDSSEAMYTLFPNMDKAVAQNILHPFKPNEKISIVLDEAEYKRYLDMQKELTKGYEATNDAIAESDEESLQQIMDYKELETMGMQFSSAEQAASERKVATSNVRWEDLAETERAKYRDQLVDKLRGVESNFLGNPMVKQQIEAYTEQGLKYAEAVAAILKSLPDDRYKNLKAVMDQRTGHIRESAKGSQAIKMLARAASEIKSIGEIPSFRSYMRANLQPKYAQDLNTRYWTPSDLERLIRPDVDRSISLRNRPVYKKLVENHDWDGALNYLKNTSVVLDIKNDKGEVVGKQNTKYAGRNDQLLIE